MAFKIQQELADERTALINCFGFDFFRKVSKRKTPYKKTTSFSFRMANRYIALKNRSKFKLIQGQINPKSKPWLIADTDIAKYRRA